MSRLRSALIHVTLLALVNHFCLQRGISAQEGPQRLVEPTLASQEASQKLVIDVFKGEFEKAKTREQRIALSRKMLQLGLETRNDPSGQFVLFKMASDAASQECEAPLALMCLDSLGRHFEIDLLKSQASVLTRVSHAASQPNQHRMLAGQFSTLLDACLAAERLDIALPLAKVALDSARECKDKLFLNRATARQAEIADWFEKSTAIKEPLTVLEDRPLDPPANLTVGRYHCFTRGAWKGGIPMLALGNDAALKELATLELAERPDWLRLGDGWWELSGKETASTRIKIQHHAAQFYRLALPSLTGLTKSKVESRLKELMPTGKVPGERLTNSMGMQLAYIPDGEFIMGAATVDDLAQPTEKPQHYVRLTRPFYIAIHEVTQEQFERMLGKNSSKNKGNQNPVECVTWFEAVEFCQRLSALPEERKAKRVYRLPTEAEWEYACRAGTTSRYFFGDDSTSLTRYAWFKDNANGVGHPVGQKAPNSWGLYDMTGNVAEWCQDWYDPHYYAKSPWENPEGPREGITRVLRGGTKGDGTEALHSAARGSLRPQGNNWSSQGFRVVCEL